MRSMWGSNPRSPERQSGMLITTPIDQITLEATHPIRAELFPTSPALLQVLRALTVLCAKPPIVNPVAIAIYFHFWGIDLCL